MEITKYYYPNIDEIRIGYECEINDSLGYSIEYIPTVIGYKEENGAYTDQIVDIIHMMDDGYGEVRVPFLSKEQIEAEGWRSLSGMYGNFYKEHPEIVSYGNEYFSNGELVNSDSDWIWYDKETQNLNIESFKGDRLFYGKCPDINTFRLICKLIGIGK